MVPQRRCQHWMSRTPPFLLRTSTSASVHLLLPYIVTDASAHSKNGRAPCNSPTSKPAHRELPKQGVRIPLHVRPLRDHSRVRLPSFPAFRALTHRPASARDRSRFVAVARSRHPSSALERAVVRSLAAPRAMVRHVPAVDDDYGSSLIANRERACGNVVSNYDRVDNANKRVTP